MTTSVSGICDYLCMHARLYPDMHEGMHVCFYIHIYIDMHKSVCINEYMYTST